MRSRLLAWLATRLAAAWLTMSVAWAHIDGNADVVGPYYQWHRLIMSGAIPYRDFHLEYPPAVVPLLALPGWSVRSYAAAFLLAALIADGYTAWRLHRSGHARGTLLWIFAPIALGPIFWGRFDVFLAAAVVLGVLASIDRRPVPAVLWWTAAVLLKLWPIVIPLLALSHPDIRRRFGLPGRKWIVAGSAGAVAAAAAAIFSVGGGLMWMLRYHVARGLEVESIWALPALAIRDFGRGESIVSAYGCLEVHGPWTHFVAVFTLPVLLIGLGWLAWSMACRWRPKEPWTATCLGVTVIVLIGSKVLSAQYAAWALAAVAVAVDFLPMRRELIQTLGLYLAATQLFAISLTYSNVLPHPWFFNSLAHALALLIFGLMALRAIRLSSCEARSELSVVPRPRQEPPILPARTLA